MIASSVPFLMFSWRMVILCLASVRKMWLPFWWTILKLALLRVFWELWVLVGWWWWCRSFCILRSASARTVLLCCCHLWFVFLWFCRCICVRGWCSGFGIVDTAFSGWFLLWRFRLWVFCVWKCLLGSLEVFFVARWSAPDRFGV